MPQPLARVNPNARVFLTTKFGCTHHPQLVLKVVQSVAISAQIENLFAGIMTTMLGAQARPAAAMLRTLHSMGVKSQAIRAAAEEALEPEILDLFIVVTDLCDAAAKHRHRFVHWSWAASFEVPDALLFIDPRTLLEHEINAPGDQYPNEGRVLHEVFDLNGVQVYRENDLEATVRKLEQAHDHLAAFRMCVNRLVKPHMPNYALYQRLLAVPEIASKLDRLRAQQKSAPEA